MDVKEIETAIAQLPPAKVAELAEWCEEFHGRIWDRQLEQDLKAGRLDSLLKEAMEDLDQLWSVRVGDHYRALGLDGPETIVWSWIGSHADYDKLV